MGFTIDVIDNSPAYLAAMKEGVAKAVKLIAKQASSNVADITPVGTPESTGKPGYIGGTLKNSITGRSDADTAYISTDVEYSIYVEFGTYKMAAKPYMRPGIMNNMDEYEEIAKEAIESCLP